MSKGNRLEQQKTNSATFYERTIPLHAPNVEVHALEPDLLLYHADDEVAVSLNASAKEIWQLCRGVHSIKDISQELADSLPEIELEDIFGDVVATITRLEQVGFLELSTR
ncbi:hypothetical protein Lepto7376_3463 [[Leptolyngbya] sp. PCC 7376]|uniref:PqqD family protein n=1 Tax=[Leptolyngbya] sp. PCC 7376 TaxID=111781 RepID=UPI00029F24C0|nr:PqqD family protein [[Leptolyngbya] sp. PCC 7376]AFY39666.1 hypothetical protein Lepto7376_3463 [[Leptolyngbya] sp. PCC 7376]